LKENKRSQINAFWSISFNCLNNISAQINCVAPLHHIVRPGYQLLVFIGFQKYNIDNSFIQRNEKVLMSNASCSFIF